MKLLLIPTLCITLISCEVEYTNPPDNSQVDQLFSKWNTDERPGAAVAVVKNGQVIFEKGYGMANLEYDVRITPSTIFHIASISKQFTAFAVLLLEQDGKLNYDDDVRKYIPELKDFGHTITLRHLVHHTSGLRDQWSLLAMAGWRLDDVITKAHIMKLLSRQEELNFSPGEQYLYCNSGYTLLAEVVARVSGMKFSEFTDQRIFKPLEMKNTLFYDDHEKIVKNRAYSYGSDDGVINKRVLSYANVGATSLFTTVQDLCKWAMNFEDPKVGNISMISKMKKRGVLNNGDTISYAFGQVVGEYKGLERISHGGADAGYRTYLARFPEQNFSVVVLSNDAEFNPGKSAMEVAELFLADRMVHEPEGIKEETTPLVVSAEILETYVGDFELQPGFVIKFRIEKDGSFSSQATGQIKLDLTAITETSFDVEGVDAKIVFEPNEGAVNKATLLQGGESPLKRIEAFDDSQVDLKLYEGIYYSKELETEYRLIVENDTLVVRHSRHPDIELIAVSEHQFIGNRWFFGATDLLVDDEGKVTGMKVTSGRVRDLRFVKR